MKTRTVSLSEKGFQNLHKFLGRADLKGNEVPDFLQLLQELRPMEGGAAAEEPVPAVGAAATSGSR